MKIWVDADACPVVIKEILFRVADKRQVPLILVANQFIRTPPSKFISTIQVEQGFDVADDKIADSVEPGDLVITADIPLANDVIENKGHALNPRGELYTQDNIRQRLAMRDFMEEMRSSGENIGGPPPLNQKDRKLFADQLDRFLSKNLKR